MMKLAYDAQADALYITMAAGKVARTAVIDDGTNVDLDEDGSVHGIEVLTPGRPWPLAEILRRYEISDDDAAMLIASCPFMCSVTVG